MSKRFSKEGGASRRWRPGAFVASVAIVAMTATACGGGGGGGNNNASGSSNGGGSSTAAAKASCGLNSTDPYLGEKAADAPSVTANTDKAKLPQGKPGKGKPPVKIGSKNFAESTLLAQLYGQALAAKGYTVQYQPQIGASEIIDKAFQSNQIDMYPEYLGDIASSLAQNPPQKNAKGTYNKAKKYEQSQRDATIFKQTPYHDVDLMLVTPQFCKQHKLKSAADLVNVGNKGSKVTFTAQGAGRTRYSGFKGLQKAYGLTNAKFKGAPTGGSTLQVVKNGGANVADGFSTTVSVVQAVKKGEFVVLKDPKHIMGFQHVAPVVKQSVAKKEGPAFQQTLNWVSAKITMNVINALNKAVQLNHNPENQVAKKFLSSNGLK